MVDLTSSNDASNNAGLTVGEFARYIAPRVWDQERLLHWPPDVFALVAALLLKSGAYVHAISGWQRSTSLESWIKDLRAISSDWRTRPNEPPQVIRDWHATLVKNQNQPISNICSNPELCNSLLSLSAAADEACVGVGCTLLSLGSSTPTPSMLVEASKRLAETTLTYGVSTLCKEIHPTTVRLLPKLHTPQSGITIRSLSHNLALCPAGDVKAKWAERLPIERRYCLNLLLAPWPLDVSPAHFEIVPKPRCELQDMPDEFGFFEYNPPAEKPRSGLRKLLPGEQESTLINRLDLLLQNARKIVRKIDGVVFPELALTVDQYEQIGKGLMAEEIFLIGGVRDDSRTGGLAAKNYLQFEIPFTGGIECHRQDKHHRWQIDKRQIVQYGLGSSLDVRKNWWEHVSIGSRELYFVVLDDWLTVCPLICEDLARQDPIAELVRAVGPNLVIALLMDGPQLPSRWPARYATVLADDPGCSVLTLTSVGMAELSRPPHVQGTSRAVALWKDAKSGEAVSIVLPPKMEGIILSLSCKFVKEFTADGRDDRGATGYPTLSGIHYVRSGL
jgi:hypothetical protein